MWLRKRKAKKKQEIEIERRCEIERFSSYAHDMLASGTSVDLQAIERGFRDAALRDGNVAFHIFLSMMKDGEQECPDCHTRLEKVSDRKKTIVSLLGTGVISRGYYECPVCHGHFIPRDAIMGIENTAYTPGVRFSVSKLAVAGSFEWTSDTLAGIADIYVSAKECQRVSESAGAVSEVMNQERIVATMCPEPPRSQLSEHADPTGVINATYYTMMDGTGVPMSKREVAGRSGKQPDGTAKTREVKIGCAFTQSSLDKDGRPVRDDNSTTYFGAIETAEKFGWRMFAESQRREANKYVRRVVIGDGAKWVWGLAKQHFPNAIHIVDIYHAKEHLHELVRELFSKPEERTSILEDWIATLESGNAKALAEKILAIPNLNETQKAKALTEANYFIENADRMRYAEFKEQKLFVGSGVIEAGCKTVAGNRLKQSGMFWSLKGANAIISLRCVDLSCDGDFAGIFAPKRKLMNYSVA